MEWVSQGDVDAELRRVEAVDNGAVGPDRANFAALRDEDFELLLYALYKHDEPGDDGYDDVRLMITGADQGRDVWLTQGEKPVGLVQCKRVKAGFTLPDTIREIVKFLLNSALEPALLPEPSDFCFELAVSADPAGTTTDFFQAPKSWLTANEAAIETYVSEVLAAYTAFSAFTLAEVLPQIKAALPKLRYKLTRPVDLDARLEAALSVRQRFFKVKLVIGITEAEAMIDRRFVAAGLIPGPKAGPAKAVPKVPGANSAPSLHLDPAKLQAAAPAVDTSVLDQAVKSEVRKFRRQRGTLGDDLVPRAERFAVRLDQGLQHASDMVRADAFQEIAAIMARADRFDDARTWIERAAALGADVTTAEARIFLLEGQPEEAMRLLRAKDDSLAKSLMIDAVQRRDGEDAALRYYAEKHSPSDLTGHALQSMAVRMMTAGRSGDAIDLLEQASQGQIDENPILLFVRGRLHISKALPADIGNRFSKSDGMIPYPGDVRDDAEGQKCLEAAKADFERLKDAAQDLDAPDLLKLVEGNLIFLSLNMGSQNDRVRARENVIEQLATSSAAMELVPLAAIYDIEADWTAIRKALDEAELFGGWDAAQLLAAFTLTMRTGAPKDIVKFMERHGESLAPFHDTDSDVAIEVEARCLSGDLPGAKALASRKRNALSEAGAKAVDILIAEAEGADSVALRIERYADTGATHDLLILVDALRTAGDDRLGEYLVRLWRSRHQAVDARRACDALVSSGQDLEAEAFLEELGDEARQDPGLHAHLAWARYRQGRLSDAAEELAALTAAGVDNGNSRQLTVMLAVETGRWSELEAHVQAELKAQDKRTADELMAAAHIAQVVDSGASLALARAAVAKAPKDSGINMSAYTIAAGLGVERTVEVNSWVGNAIAEAREDGPVQMKDMNEIIAMVKDSRAATERVNDMVNKAAVPMFIALRRSGSTQSALVLQRLWGNAEEPDSRRKNVLPLFAGNRAPTVSDSPRSIALEPLSILVLDYLGLLEKTIEAFEDVVLPAGTLHAFFEDRARGRHNQPSRIEQASGIKERIARGVLNVEALAEGDAAIAAAVDTEFARLYRAATARDGYVVETAPLHPPGRLDVEVDPSPYADRLLSPAGLVTVLVSEGILSANAAVQAGAIVAASGQAWAGEAPPPSGKPLFVTGLALQYLADANLLPQLKTHAGALIILPEVVEQADHEIATGEAAVRIRQGIDRICETLARAISSGQARVGPIRFRGSDRESDEDSDLGKADMSPIMSAFRDSAGVEAMICDDRAMNKFPKFTDNNGTDVRFLTTPDLLHILHAKNAISDHELAMSREKLRMGAAGLMPMVPEELVEAARRSNWAVGPNAELRLIRDSIHQPLARQLISLPEERLWLQGICFSIGYAVRQVWQDLDDPRLADRAATYLWDILPDVGSLSEMDESPDRGLWVQEVTRQSLWAVASIFDLPADRIDAFQSWFAREVAPGIARRDPGAMDAMAKTLVRFLTAPMEEDSDGTC